MIRQDSQAKSLAQTEAYPLDSASRQEMADVFSETKRSQVMARIRASGNADTELLMARILRRFHVNGWRRRYPLIGHPDFVFPRQRVALFVDGCFWHSCPKHGHCPKSNRDYWQAKLENNQRRDKSVVRQLSVKGWIVVRIWEHELSDEVRVARKLQKALGALSLRQIRPAVESREVTANGI